MSHRFVETGGVLGGVAADQWSLSVEEHGLALVVQDVDRMAAPLVGPDFELCSQDGCFAVFLDDSLSMDPCGCFGSSGSGGCGAGVTGVASQPSCGVIRPGKP